MATHPERMQEIVLEMDEKVKQITARETHTSKLAEAM
jgi:hypothetical protein